MIYVKYTPNSLLYGESYFWLVLTFVAPAHLAPNFRTTRSEHAVKQIPCAGLVMRWITWVSENRLAKTMLAQLFLLFQFVYLILYVAIGVSVQTQVLSHYGIRESDMLTYKVLALAPTLFRFGLLIISLINMQDLNYDIWRVYDKFGTLSISTSYQARAAKWCLASVLPDALLNVTETMFLIKVLLPTTDLYKSGWLASIREFKWIWELPWTPSVILAGLMNIMVRYKPVINLTYAATCASEHMEYIYSQVTSAQTATTGTASAASAATTRTTTTTATTAAPGEKSTCGVSQRQRMLSSVSSSLSNEDTPPPITIWHNPSPREHKPQLVMLDRVLEQDEPQESTENNNNNNNNNNQSNDDHHNHHHQDHRSNLYIISNLYQLERHLTELQLFISDIDRESPATILALTIINSLTYFYALFFTSYIFNLQNIILMIVYCSARSLPLVRMFLAGSRLEKSCHRMNDKLEQIYFQEQSHSLIYKQMAGSHLSLARVFRLLKGTRLNCNNLMEVNKKTLRMCAIYIATVILIVVQYDSLVGYTEQLA